MGAGPSWNDDELSGLGFTTDAATTGDGSLIAVAKAIRANVLSLNLANISSGEYETVAASSTGQILGATGAVGDWVSGLLVIPATTSPGNVLLLDGATSITVFTGGASSVSNLVPFLVPLGIKAVGAGWSVTTGTAVSVIGIGNFT